MNVWNFGICIVWQVLCVRATFPQVFENFIISRCFSRANALVCNHTGSYSNKNECGFCKELYHEDEMWLQCPCCKIWFHEQCFGK